MTQLRYLFLAVVVVGMCVMAAPAVAQDTRDDSDRWEISYFYGGAIGRTVGSHKVTCTQLTAPFVKSGCDTSQVLQDRGTPGGVFPGQGQGELKNFLATGGIKPQKGPLNGFRLGFDITPRWQFEFKVSYAQVDLAFENRDQLLGAQNAFDNSFAQSAKSVLAPDGRPQGNLQLYIGDLIHNFAPYKRIVFYVGGGGGAIKWYNGPKALLILNKDPRFGLTTRQASFSKTAGGDSGFALNTVAGIKIHASRHLGFRIEAMNILGFPRVTTEFRTIDISGQCQAATGASCQTLADTPGSFVDLSGHLHQSTTFNYFVITVGSFIRFGGH